MPTKDFAKRVDAAIKERLGTDAREQYSMEQLIGRLGLTVSRETLRKVLREGHMPREKTRKQLLSEIAAAPAPARDTQPTAESFYGSATADEIRSLLGRDASFFKVETPPDGNEADLLINQLGGQRILVRCLDDQVREGLAAEHYYRPTVDRLVEAMHLLDIDRALLITHTTPSPRAVRMADMAKVSIQTYAAFIQQVLDFHGVERTLAGRLSQRGLDRGYLSLPVWKVTRDGDTACTNSYELLLEFLEEARGVAVATVLGSYGSGKTSLALKVAHKISGRSVKDRNKWTLPIWVDARSIDQSTFTLNLDSELTTALRALAPTSQIGPGTLRRLISSGRAWLFVDGLDEAITLRSHDKLRRFLDALLDCCQPHGRLILTIRQEVFNGRSEELAFFADGMLMAGAKTTLVLRTRAMETVHIEQIIYARRKQSEANRLIEDIRRSEAVRDLVTRPIFLDILTNAGALPEAGSSSGATLELFETYVNKWVAEEQRRTTRLDLPSDVRLEICEVMALHAIRHGDGNGISLNDIDTMAHELDKKFSIRNLEAFVLEARVAMFLERDLITDRFHFSHASLRSFFVARAIGREIAVHQIFRNLERFALDRSDPMLRFFLIEELRGFGQNPLDVLESILAEAVQGINPPNSEHTLFEVGPCFSYLIPNLCALILAVRAELNDTSTPLFLQGAHLARFDLDSIWGTKVTSPIRLDAANLEGAKLTVWCKNLGDKAIPPGSIDPAHVRGYCEEHRLLAPARFSEDDRDRFVLIPGGSYRVAQQSDEQDVSTFVEVQLRSYLIQRYPVTNRQFRAFLRENPQFLPARVREETSNPYYLLHWPTDDSDARTLDPDWLDRPVVHVNWQVASAFAAACGLRLPTEVEWEVASRYTGDGLAETTRPWGADIDRSWALFWDAGDDDGQDLRERSKEARTSPPLLPSRTVYKLQSRFDEWARGREVPFYMVDFIREWVADRWDHTFPCMARGAVAFSHLNSGFLYDCKKSAWLPNDGRQELRVLRGGSFQTTAEDCSSIYRASHPPKNVNPDVGFRCVRPVGVPSANRRS